MDYTLRWRSDPESEGSSNAPEDLLIITSGRVSVRDLEAMCESAWADPRFRPGLKTLIDHRASRYGGLSQQDVQERARWIAARRPPEVSGSRTAVVVSRAVDYGVWRMFQTYVADDIDFEIEIFATPEEARSWLGESRSYAE